MFRTILAPLAALVLWSAASVALACPTAMDCPMGTVIRDFSASPTGVVFDANNEDPNNTYCIIGSSGNDSLTGGNGNDTICGGDGTDVLTGGNGDDNLSGGRGQDTINGNDGNDTIDGGGANDILNGGNGNDNISGGGGQDTINGNDGDDVIDGGTNNDTINGGNGNDQISGGSGRDTLSGNDGNDFIDGQDGNDSIDGGEGDDTLVGGNDNDIIIGGNGNDGISGGAGDDNIQGNSGVDIINGDDGNDTIDGGGSDDIINGGNGNDILNGGANNDTVSGGDGNDTINGDGGQDILNGDDGDDTINGNEGNDTINGGEGNDNLNGNENDDLIFGGNGNDTITGGHGQDDLNGDAGNDNISGGVDDDVIRGNDGDDVLNGDDGNDTILGGNGNDELNGGNGDDQLFGEDGMDTLNGGDGDDFLEGNFSDGTPDGFPDTLDGGTGDDQCLQSNNMNFPMGEESIGGGCETLTPVVLGAFGASASAGGTVVEWTTLAEYGTQGFHLFRIGADQVPVKLNEHMLVSVHTSPLGGAYRFFDRSAEAGGVHRYVLVEQDVHGRRQILGPFDVVSEQRAGVRAMTAGDYEVAPRALPQVAAQPFFRGGTGTSALRVFAGGGASQVKVAVDSAGLQKVPADLLSAQLGLSEAEVLERIQKGNLEVRVGDEPVAWTPAEDGLGIAFFGLPADSIYTRENIYWIAAAPGKTMAAVSPAPVAGAGDASFRKTLRFEEDLFDARVIPVDAESDHWFWRVVSPTTPGREAAQVNFTVSGLAASGEAAVLRLDVQGASSEGVAGEHVLRIRVNGNDLGLYAFEGFERTVLSVDVPHALLKAGKNRVDVIGELPEGVDANVVYVNSVELEYERNYVADSDAFEFDAEDHSALSVSGLSRDDLRLLDVTDPNAPKLVNVAFQAVGNAFKFDFQPEAGARYALVAEDAAVSPEVWADAASDLRAGSNAADYVIITRGDMREAAQKLADHRETQGLTTLLVDVEDIYDEFANGLATPHALHEFLAHAATSWKTAPKYVVLAGAASFDYRDNLNLGGNVVPTLQVSSERGLFSSDSRLADLVGDDGIPDVALGRLPARSAEELASVVSKLVAYDKADASAWEDQVVLAAGRQIDSAPFAADTSILEKMFSSKYTVHTLSADAMEIGDAQGALLDQIDAGASWVNYFGHSAFDRFADDLFTREQAAGLTNGDRLPVVTAMTCLAGGFDYPGITSLGEELLGNPNGGAVAVWSATSSSIHEESARLATGFAGAMLHSENRMLGDAMLSAHRAYGSSADPALSSVIHPMYALLGDPATNMHLTVDPELAQEGDDGDGTFPVDDTEGDGGDLGTFTKLGGGGLCSVQFGGPGAGTPWILIGLVVGFVLYRRRR